MMAGIAGLTAGHVEFQLDIVHPRPDDVITGRCSVKHDSQ